MLNVRIGKIRHPARCKNQELCTIASGFLALRTRHRIKPIRGSYYEGSLKNIQIIDGGDNATFSIFQATDEEFKLIFPRPGQDLEVAETAYKRLGKKKAGEVFGAIWERPILKPDDNGLHGTLFYNYFDKRQHLPKTKREIDRVEGQINQAQRDLNRAKRDACDPASTDREGGQTNGVA